MTGSGLLFLNLLLGAGILLNVLRIVMSWYPQVPMGKMPYVLVCGPTEPMLWLIRKVVPPFAGIDMAPVVAVGLFSLIRELLLGQQGLLTLLGS
ncbi:MAG: YggT family protein [Oscillatoriales cyanobacterium SM2_2_1]|nr:YggT family protein [Oscillatoriales cyanobacterium SM2_2_1]